MLSPMRRREFLLSSAAAASLATLGTRLDAATATPDETLRAIIRDHDAQIPGLLAKQERRPGH